MSILAEHPRCNPACRVCHYKDLAYSDQIRRKQDWAREKLEPWSDRLAEIIKAPENERIEYRSKSWMRAQDTGIGVSFGIYRAIRIGQKWGKEFISWDGCPIHSPAIQSTLEKLGTVLTERAPGFVAESLQGVWIGTPHLVLVARGGLPDVVRNFPWSEIVSPPIDCVWFHRNPQVGRKTFGHEGFIPLLGSIGSTDPAGTHPIRAFRQIAQTLLREARARAIEALVSSKPEWVLDLYCGTGELSRLLPASTGWLGIEISPDAVTYANTIREDGRVRQRAYVGTVEQRMCDPRVREQMTGNFAIYLNPPRSGLTAEAREMLRELLREESPSTIVYLSCSASSLARDLEAFTREGYRVESLQPYDFFPQTEHFETLAVLSYGSSRK